MTEQELKEIKLRFEMRIADSDKWGEFLNHHEPDVARLLDEVERLRKENDRLLTKNNKLIKQMGIAFENDAFDFVSKEGEEKCQS